jgi:hypothetical protein
VRAEQVSGVSAVSAVSAALLFDRVSGISGPTEFSLAYLL